MSFFQKNVITHETANFFDSLLAQQIVDLKSTFGPVYSHSQLLARNINIHGIVIAMKKEKCIVVPGLQKGYPFSCF